MSARGADRSAGDLAVTSLAACLASLLELDVVSVPVAEGDGIRQARDWLATRGLGLVPVLDPPRFGWGGPWIARGSDGVAVIAFGTPPGVVADPSGEGPAEAAQFAEGWVVAPVRAATFPPLAPVAPAVRGTVEAMLVAQDATGPMRRLDRAAALAGRGLESDRYARGEGTFSVPGGTGNDLTLVEGEMLDRLGITPEAARRNLVTRGVELDDLVGRRFTVGGVECIGRRRCEPCAHLERLSPGTLRPLVHRGGLRADLLGGGEIAVGAEILVVP